MEMTRRFPPASWKNTPLVKAVLIVISEKKRLRVQSDPNCLTNRNLAPVQRMCGRLLRVPAVLACTPDVAVSSFLAKQFINTHLKFKSLGDFKLSPLGILAVRSARNAGSAC